MHQQSSTAPKAVLMKDFLLPSLKPIGTCSHKHTGKLNTCKTLKEWIPGKKGENIIRDFGPIKVCTYALL